VTARGSAELHRRLDELLRSGRASWLHGLVVVQGGRTLLEHYGEGEDSAWIIRLGRVSFGPDTFHDLRSVTKSVVGLLYGIALADKLVPDPSEPLLPHFPEYPDLAADPGRARLTVEHALTMSLGLEWREEFPYDNPGNGEVAMELAPDRYRYVLERPVVAPPGTAWTYCGGASALLGRLISTGTGSPLPDVARDTLFAPLGIGTVEWMSGFDGVASAASGLRMAPRDLARIGRLVLSGGRWDGQQVVPAEWLEAMLCRRLPVDERLGYGYQWYLGGSRVGPAGAAVRWVGAMGNGGQRLYVAQDLDLVVAMTAGDYDGPDQARLPRAVLEEVVLPALAG
jgi:CubicO group peptidase (beta-lactamase class C family)